MRAALLAILGLLVASCGSGMTIGSLEPDGDAGLDSLDADGRVDTPEDPGGPDLEDVADLPDADAADQVSDLPDAADAGDIADAVDAVDAPDGVEVADLPDTTDAEAETGGVTPDDGTAGEADAQECLLPGAGELLITEIMAAPEAVDDPVGEWFEVTNRSGHDVCLAGCEISYGAGGAATIEGSGDGVRMPADAIWVFGASADEGQNGGIAVDIEVIGLSLDDASDLIVIDCDSTLVDMVVYNTAEGWPVQAGASMSFGSEHTQDAESNDDPTRWCVSPPMTGDGDAGSPGEPNPSCTPSVDWCALIAPVSATAVSEGEITVVGRYFEPGISDQTSGLDAWADLVAEVGVGPDGTDPVDQGQDWSWTAANGTVAWDDTSATPPAGPGEDEYRATIAVPAPGSWDLAFRFSLDQGETWVHCDTSWGDDGAYLPAEAGDLTSIADPCDPNPCDGIPPTCDGEVAVLYEPDGTCSLDESNEPVCDYSEAGTIDCAALMGTCVDGTCEGGARLPLPGELIFNEIMRDPDAIDDALGEWIELYNASAELLVLDHCVLTAGSAGGHVILPESPLLIDAGELVLLARSGADNGLGDAPVAYVYGDEVVLGGGAEVLGLQCPPGPNAELATIDGVDITDAFLTDEGERPAIGAAGSAIQLDARFASAADNDLGAYWCDADTAYASGDFGTPGSANTGCPVPEPVDWCRLQWPLTIDAEVGDSVTIYGRVYEAGITDATAGVDTDPALLAQVGYGTPDSDPSSSPSGWTFIDAEPNAGWDDATAGEPNNDEYQATFPAPEAGIWDYACRFSADGGLTWLYCDLPGGAVGEDGSENGYQVDNAGVMTTTAYCTPNPCTELPDEPTGCAGDVLTTYELPGVCTAVDGVETCEYPPTVTDCAESGLVCDDFLEVCTDAPTTEWCRLGLPASAVTYEGEALAVSGRIFALGITDATVGVDPDPDLLVQVGYGPDGSDPSADDTGWAYLDAAGTPDWDGSAVGTPDDDDYTLTFPAPPAGTWDYAYRMSTDGGASWLYCDLDPGSSDGYQPESAGDLQVLVDPCDPNPCDEPPEADTCLGDLLRAYELPGACTDEGGAAACSYTLVETDCAAGGLVCNQSDPACIEPPPPWPAPGTVIFTEIHYNPENPGDTDGGEWFEVHNLTGDAVYLGDCVISDGEGSVPIDEPLVLDGGAYVVFGAGDNTATTGFSPDFVYGSKSTTASQIVLSNATDDLSLSCPDGLGGDQLIDAVTYDHSLPWPSEVPGRTVQLADWYADATHNDLGTSWCIGDTPYPGGDYGTPGAATDCHAPVPVSWCRLQFPSEVTPSAGTLVTVYGRVYVAGQTDLSPAVDTHPDVIGQVGYGPDGSMPSADDTGWVYADAGPTPGWDAAAAGEPTNDEYVGELTAPAPGEWDYAFRFSADAGLTWRYCDLDTGVAGQDGAENGYQSEAAGAMTVTAGPCLPNPCDTPPAGDGCAGDVLTIYPKPGICTDDAGAAVCDYTPAVTDCAAGGLICDQATLSCQPPPSVDWCRLQWPEQIAEYEGTVVDVYGRVYLAGLTDLTTGTDADADLLGQVAYGPDGSDPRIDDTGWVYLDAAPTPGWDAGAAGEPDNDEYVATFPAPAEGLYDYAFRFSGDGGATWLYCDLVAGSSDGYAPANAGDMLTLVDPCNPVNPCDTPPAADSCAGDVLTDYPEVGTCTDEGGTAACDYTPTVTDCAIEDLVCDPFALACVPPGLAQPGPGDVIFTEILYNPENPGDTAGGEWFEVHNVGAQAHTLQGCTVTDGEGSVPIDEPVSVGVGAYAVFASADNSGITGFVPAFIYGGKSTSPWNIALSNAADDLTLTCPDGAGGDTVIDQVAYSDSAPWPTELAGHSIQLDGASMNATANNQGSNWCLSEQAYTGGDFGTPGAANDCPGQLTVGWCRLQWPEVIAEYTGTSLSIYGRVYSAGLTDQTTGTDANPILVGELGYGPDASDPTLDDTGWVYVGADPTPGWDGAAAGEADNDEYVATLVTPAEGIYDYAFRFSVDAGLSWTWCDLDPGSSDGYSPADAGDMLTVTDPCSPNPCTTPPAADGCAGDVLTIYADPGACTDNAGAPACDYGPTTTDCAASGQTCDGATLSCIW